MLAGKMQFIPSVQLSRSPHSPDASDGTLRKERVDVCTRGWRPLMCCWRHCKQEAIYTSGGVVHTLPDERKILLLNTRSPSSQQHLSLIFVLISRGFGHLMGVKDREPNCCGRQKRSASRSIAGPVQPGWCHVSQFLLRFPTYSPFLWVIEQS